MRIRILSVLLVVTFIVGIFPFTIISKAYAEDSSLILWYKFNDDSDTSVVDSSGYGNNGTIKGDGASLKDGTLTLSDSAYVELPKGMFDGHNSLTISMWLKNDSGKGNYSAMFFGTTESYPSQYWLLNPCNPSGLLKSVITNSLNASAPWNTEYGISPTNSSQGIAGPSTNASWAFYTTVIEPTGITAYYNGVKIGTVSTNRTVSQFGKDLVAYIGKSSYSDPYFKGAIKDVKVYTSALTEAQIKEDNAKTVLEKDKNALSLKDTRVIGNLSLPTTGADGSIITWKSSNTKYITDDGIVTRPENGMGDANVTMTATLSKDGIQVTKDFSVVVLENSSDKDSAYLKDIAANFDIGIKYVTEDITLPTSTTGGVSVSWKSNNEEILSSTGKVTRPESGDEQVTLIATLQFGQAKAEKTFDVTVAEKSYGYLLSYVVSGNTDRTDCLHIAYSKDGQSYTPLNNNKGICYTAKGSNKMGSPAIFRKADGTYGLIASDDNNSSYIIVMDSDDLLTYKNERYSQVDNKGINVIDPSCHFDASVNEYRIDFKGSDGKYYSTTTKDFITFSDFETTTYSKANVTGSLPQGAIEASAFGVTKDEYDKVVEKYSRVKNTDIKPVPNVEVQAGTTITLPEKVTAEYSDGSTKDMGVAWDQDALKAIDTSKAGTYNIKGTVQQEIYKDPLIEERADPYVVLGADGYYYFTASYPTHGDNDTKGYDRIILRRAKNIEELQNAPEITLWDVSKSTKCFRYIWAPEMHYINGKWYIFYTASRSSNVWDIRPHILECDGDGDPYKPDNWVERGQVKPISGDSFPFSAFSLDMTYFSCNGKHYVAWAQTSPSSIYLATIDPDKPWQLTSKAICLTAPQYAWERNNGTVVNEGPAVLKHDGKIYLCFSASAVDSSYCIGMISANDTDNLLNISSWTKNAYPLLTSDDFKGEYGPGHNSFTVDAYGNTVIVYHARPEECNNNTCEYANSSDLNDPHRHARVKNLNFAADGSPILNMTYGEELKDENKNVTVTVNITGSAENSKEVKGVSITGETVVGNTLNAQLINENGSAVTTSAAVNYQWYRSSASDFNDAELVGNDSSYNLADSDCGKYIKLKATVNSNTYESITPRITDKPLEVIPAGIKIKGNQKVGDDLTAEFVDKDGIEINISTSAAVSYKWYRSSDAEFNDALLVGENNNYSLSKSDGGKYIKLVGTYNNKSFDNKTAIIIDEEKTNEEEPAAIAILGDQKVGNTLTAEFIGKGGNVVSKDASEVVTYKWYRSSNTEFNDSELVGESDSYNLTSNDSGKYIKLIVTYGNKNFENTTSRIIKIQSSSSNNSRKSKNTEDSAVNSTDSNSNASSSKVDDKNTIENSVPINSETWENTIDGWKYLKNGVAVTGWNKINGYWYLMNLSGIMETGWQQINDIWYLLKSDGSMATGWQLVDDKWYYLYEDGSMASSTIIDGYTLDETGAWV